MNPKRFDYYEIRPCVERAGHVKSFLGEPQWCNSRGSHIRTPEAALEAAKAYQAKYGGKLFWTLYGMEDGIAAAIGDFKSFRRCLRGHECNPRATGRGSPTRYASTNCLWTTVVSASEGWPITLKTSSYRARWRTAYDPQGLRN